MSIEAYAKGAYDAYKAAAGGKSLATGAPLPEWDALPGPIRKAWEASAAWVAGMALGIGVHADRADYAFRQIVAGTLELEDLERRGLNDGEAAVAVRDTMDGPYHALSEADKALCSRLSASLACRPPATEGGG